LLVALSPILTVWPELVNTEHSRSSRLMTRPAKVPVKINRRAPPISRSPFTDYFRGFEKVKAVRSVFGDKTEEVLAGLKVGFVSNKYMYMGVSDEDGNLGVGTYHLKNSDLRTLYLDIVHELFHVKQFMEDRTYFRREHRRYIKKTGFDTALYFKSPIEVPAYRHAVDEAKRIGMSYDEIAEYLKMGPVDPKVFARLLRDVGLERGMKQRAPATLSVRIRRNPEVRLYPFTDYFRGLEKVRAVRALFGRKTEEVLRGLKVEFSASPIRMISPDEEDGHLQVSAPYLKTGEAGLLYVDVLVCLNLIKRMSDGRTLLEGRNQDFADSRVLVESYRAAVKEAKRLGFSDSELAGHMLMPRFLMTPEGFKKFLRKVGVGGAAREPRAS